MDEKEQNRQPAPSPAVESKNVYIPPEPSKKRKFPWIIGIAAAVLIATIGMTLWWWLNQSPQIPTETQPVTKTEEETTESVTEEETTACIHQYGARLVTAPATCTVAGMQIQSCQLCGEERKEPIEPTGHTEVIDKAVDANCTETGLTEGVHCSVCKAVLVAQEVVPAKGHTLGEWIIDEEPDWDLEGSMHTTCVECSDLTTKKICISEGLKYVSNGDGTCTVESIGECTDTEIFIPAGWHVRG